VLYAATLPLMRRTLGATVDRFAAPVRRLHEVRDAKVVAGYSDIERGPGLAARLVGWLFGFPPTGRRMPTTITILCDGGVEVWHRRFAGHAVLTRLEPCPRGGRRAVVERFRFGVTFDLEVLERAGRLRFVVRGMHVCGVPMPCWLWPLLRGEEHAQAGTFHFDIDIALPGFGRLIHYRGAVRAAA